MGCDASPVWIGIVTAGVAVFFVFTIIVVNRKWDALKFFIFMRFNVLINDDAPEDMKEMEYDAFVIYR